ncbi:hypothetical protein E2P81_ATG04013 [Venturia nashicola]|nr:hypothetical protein E2P81_ATG04013 [Venturia nashicola]
MDGSLEVINGILMAFPSENNGLRQKDSCKIRVTEFRSNTSVPESQRMADLPLFILEHRHGLLFVSRTLGSESRSGPWTVVEECEANIHPINPMNNC